MPRNLLKNEAGYTLVEVMASIVILAVAIIPMVAMFDAGLRAASASGNYDTARSFANEKLEQARSLPYESPGASETDVEDNFPLSAPTLNPTDGSTTAPITHAVEAAVPEGFSYTVRKRFLTMTGTGASRTLSPGGVTDNGMIEVTVTVGWGEDNSYITTGVVSKGTL